MRQTLKEWLFAYRDIYFVAACNKNSMKWIEKLIEWGFIEIIKKEEFDEDYDGYQDIIFKVTPAFIDYYKSDSPKKHVMKPIRPKDK